MMDSLLYVGAGDEDEDNDSEDEGEGEVEGEEEVPGGAGSSSAAPPKQLDFEALQRAGYASASNLKETATYKRLEAEEAQAREDAAVAKVAAEEEERRRAEAAEKAKVCSLAHTASASLHTAREARGRASRPG